MADLSPELASRIQSLETSFADNPGRYFVALAGAWREAGEPGRAEEILREHLKRFPGLSPHVLLGRCLADRGAYQEASNEFHYVLSIDSQNLIALRTLAEMAAQSGRRDEAQRWYNELLAVDPMNAEARQALAGLARSGADAATLDQPVRTGTEWGGAGQADRVAGTASEAGFAAEDDGGFGLIDLNSEPASPRAEAQAEAAAGEWGEISLDHAAPSTPTAETQPASSSDFDAFAFGSMSLDDEKPADEPAFLDTSSSFDSAPSFDAAPSFDSAPSLGAEGTGDWLNSDARQDLGESAAADLALPTFSDDLLDAPTAGADLPLLDFSGEDDSDADGLMQLDGGIGFDGAASGGQGAGDPHDHVDAEVVTETMAELYASQGLLARAAEVYRELIQQRGDEPGLVRRLSEIEGRLNADAAAMDEGDAPAWLQGVDAFAAGTATPVPGSAAEVAFDSFSAPAADKSFSGTVDESFYTAPADDEFSTPAADDPFTGIVDESFYASTPGDAFSSDAASFGDDLDLTAGLADASGAAATSEAMGSGPAASADPFADSFSAGFDGVEAEASPSADDVRDEWTAPSVTETESEGFDLIVIADDGGEQHIHASAEEVADLSADWAVAAAPLGYEGDDEEDDVPAAAGSAAAPAARTMQSYFSSLLNWQPGGAPYVPAAEPAAPQVADDLPRVSGFDVSTADAAPYETGVSDFTVPDDAQPAADAGQADVPALRTGVDDAPVPADDRAPYQAPADDSAALSLDLPADVSGDDDVASVDDFAPIDFGTRAEDLPAVADQDDPWSAPSLNDTAAAAAQPDPWDAPLDAPAADLDLPMLDDEPWSTAPAAAADLAGFELADDLAATPSAQPDDEGLLPWEAPAAPPAPEAPAQPAGDGFSFEDFFSGPAAPESAAPPTPAAAAAPSAAFEPAPSPVTPPAPPAAQPGAPAGGQDEEDEDLESFQAWLQSLKR
ncbi:tetratricopeptide repeat protein [Longimicrobium terrae]|uniref:Tetratricopeptide (TPR) repeat protein n=1 Tax=Longimicrobium terrae TaxID=1639882 RepID=A0A841GWJ9_9BACT|nr:tetratricopeptide repeat protein [Longimicrobium terrae]MBB4635828.1 tetratricopeptide (TPR) repeat protein [Longimicrobium terrae]MBB6070224.1 tetratricopeptide (TPR) repeat protein [Longimicrobium terrae]NNC30728.1 hypothetical protein [Longimicrobium terrae]